MNRLAQETWQKACCRLSGGYCSSLLLWVALAVFPCWAFAVPTPLYLSSMSGLPELKLPLSGAEKALLAERKLLRLGIVNEDYEPLEMIYGDSLRGITADYLHLISRALGLKVKIHIFSSWEEALQGLRDEEVDMLGHATSYEAQLPGLKLSRPYVPNQPIVAAHAERLSGPALPKLSGRVAVVEAYTVWERLKEKYPNVELQVFPSVREALQAVEYKRCDWYIGDALTASYLVGLGELSEVRIRPLSDWNDQGYSFVMREDDALQGLVDRVLDLVPEASRAEVLNHWGVLSNFTTARDDYGFSSEEKLWLAGRPEVRVILGKPAPPLAFYDAAGNLQGMIADFLESVSLHTGLRFDVAMDNSLKEVESALHDGLADMSTSLQETPERSEYLQFTTPFITTSFVLVGRSDSPLRTLKALHGKRVALLKSSQPLVWFRKNHPEVQVLEVDSELDGMVAVADGHADAAGMILPVARYLVGHYFSGSLQTMTDLPELKAKVPFSVRQDQKLLYSVLSKVVLNMDPGLIGRILGSWQNANSVESSVWGRYIKTIYWLTAAGIMTLALLLLTGGYFYFKRKQERAIEEQGAFRAALLDGIPTPIMVRNNEGRFVLCNQSFYTTFNVSADQVIGRRISELSGIDPHEAEEHEQEYWELLAKQSQDLREVDIQIKGERFTFRQWAVPYKDVYGRIGGLIMGWTDLTSTMLLLQQLQDARDQAVLASEAKSRFLAVMSHEIRTPLNAIIGLLELTMLRVDKGLGWDRESIEVAYSSSNALLLLIGDILDLAKIESGKLTLEPRRCNPRQALDTVVRVFHGLARQKGLYLRSECRIGSQRDALMDDVRLKQVLSNLLSNAIKFTDSGGVLVRLSVEEVADSLQLTIDIEDSGIGISEEDQKQLFEPFSQARQPTSARGGTGLGLVICGQLTDMIGGSLHMDSQLGRGTRIRLEFRVPALEAETNKAEDSSVVHANGVRKLRVLLVDDHPANRMLLGQQLHFLGHTMEEAEDGAQAFKWVEMQAFDVIITDCNMPVMNGYELATQVRAFERKAGRTPSLICGFTANAQVEEKRRCLEAGMDDCLFKPVSLDVLSHALQSVNVTSSTDVLLAEKNALPELFDLVMIESLTGGDEKMIRMLLNQLYTSNEQDLHSMDEQLARGDSMAIGALVHRIKGAARMVGATNVVDAAVAYEHAKSEAMSVEVVKLRAFELRNAITLLQSDVAAWLINAIAKQKADP